MHLVYFAFLLCCAFFSSEGRASQGAGDNRTTTAGSSVGSYAVKFVSNMTITSFDGAVLHADGYIPIPNNASERFPVLIFPNSWSMPQFEYILKALSFAEDGYITVEYETRGWYLSGGEIDTAGSKDVRDASVVLDYVLSRGAEWQINPDKIAMVGISYGAGLSYLAAANDSRITTAVALSGWGNLTDALDENQTPSLVWGALLVLTAELLGHPPPQLQTIWQDLITHKNLTAVKAFAASRSPVAYVDQLNARNVPIFQSNNFLDRLFNPGQIFDFHSKLTVPKFLLMNKGIHAEAEAFGLLDIPHNYVWGKARLWLDYWLKGLDTGIMQEPPVQMQAGTSVLTGSYVTFPQWPDVGGAVSNSYFRFNQRGAAQFGALSPVGAPRSSSSFRANLTSDSILYSELPGIDSGIPIVTDVLTTVGVDAITDLGLVNHDTAILWQTPPLQQTTRICGEPAVNITVQANNWARNGNWQLFGFLYDVDGLDVGTLISDSRFSHWTNQWGTTTTADQTEEEVGPRMSKGTAVRRSVNGNDGSASLITIENWRFHGICREVPAGHKIGVGFALYSNLYVIANSSSSLTVNFAYGDSGSELLLPVMYV